MKKPILLPRNTNTMKSVSSISEYDFDGPIENAIQFLQDIKDRYPNEQVVLDKEYDSTSITIYKIVQPETEEEFEVRKIQYEKDLAAYQEWQAEQLKEQEKQLYLRLKAKYEN